MREPTRGRKDESFHNSPRSSGAQKMQREVCENRFCNYLKCEQPSCNGSVTVPDSVLSVCTQHPFGSCW